MAQRKGDQMETAYNRAYLVTCLRHSAQILLRRTSDTLETLYDIPPLRRIRKYKNMGTIVSYGG